MGILQCESQDMDDYMFAYRLRTTDMLENLMFPIHKELGNSGSASDRLHNSLFYLPEEQYKGEHPNFYSTQGEQLCYTAHGDSDEYETMVDICAQKVEQSIKWYPTLNTVHIGIMDNWQSCQCDACKAFAASHNNAESAAVYKFVQDMARKVVDWMNLPENAEYKRDDLQFTFFAYQWTLKPPFEIKDDKVIIADDIVPDSDLKIKPFNAFSSFDFGVRMDSPANAEQIEYATQWARYVSDGWSWTYGCFFNDYFCFYDPYSFYDDYYKWLYEQKYQFTFAQFHSRQRGADTGFYTLANYLTCKLTWDSSLNTAELIDDYFNAMYSDAADAMKEVFYECRIWFAEAHEYNGWGWSSNQLQPTTKTSLISLGFVNTLFNKLDKAYAAIEKYQKDEATYSKLKEHSQPILTVDHLGDELNLLKGDAYSLASRVTFNGKSYNCGLSAEIADNTVAVFENGEIKALKKGEIEVTLKGNWNNFDTPLMRKSFLLKVTENDLIMYMSVERKGEAEVTDDITLSVTDSFEGKTYINEAIVKFVVKENGVDKTGSLTLASGENVIDFTGNTIKAKGIGEAVIAAEYTNADGEVYTKELRVIVDCPVVTYDKHVEWTDDTLKNVLNYFESGAVILAAKQGSKELQHTKRMLTGVVFNGDNTEPIEVQTSKGGYIFEDIYGCNVLLTEDNFVSTLTLGTGVKNKYYALGGNIGSAGSPMDMADQKNATDTSNFAGVFDGRGHTVYAATYDNGIFGG